MRGEKPSQT